MSIMKTPSKAHKEYAKKMATLVKAPKKAENPNNDDFKKFREQKIKSGKDLADDLFQ